MKNLNLLFYLIIPIFCFSQTEKKLLFEKLNNSTSWNLEFQDDGTTNYQKHWHLDGLIAKVENSKKGMLLQAGPEFGNDAHHMVLWTKQTFKGDVKIEFEFTRSAFYKNFKVFTK